MSSKTRSKSDSSTKQETDDLNAMGTLLPKQKAPKVHVKELPNGAFCLSLPVQKDVAKDLTKVGKQAGKGEKTVVDKKVRDSVKIYTGACTFDKESTQEIPDKNTKSTTKQQGEQKEEHTTKTMRQLRQQLGLHAKTSKSNAAKGTRKQYYTKSELVQLLARRNAPVHADEGDGLAVKSSKSKPAKGSQKKKKKSSGRNNSEDTTKPTIKEMDNIKRNGKNTSIFMEIQILSTSMEKNHDMIQEVEQLLKYARNEKLRNALQTIKEKITKHIDHNDEKEVTRVSQDEIKSRCKSIFDANIDVNRFCTILKLEDKRLRDKSEKKLDLFSRLPESVVVCQILPLFCNVKHRDSKTNQYNEVTVLDKVINLHDSISVLNCFGKTKKSFTFIGEHDTLENEPSISLKKTYHHLMCVKKYGNTPTLLKLCQTNTITLNEAKLLVEFKGRNIEYINQTDPSGKTAVFYSGLNNYACDVSKYLISQGARENDFKLGQHEMLGKKYNIDILPVSQPLNSFTSFENESILFKGCETGKMSLKDAKILVEYLNVDASEINASTHNAALKCNGNEVGNYLVSKGGNEVDFLVGQLGKKYGNPPLITGCKSKNGMELEDVKTLVEICKVDISAIDKIGNTATYYTGVRTHEKISQYLISHGGNAEHFEKGASEKQCEKCNGQREEECKACRMPLCSDCYIDGNYSDGCCKKYFCNDCLSGNYRDGKNGRDDIALCKDCSTYCEYCGYSALTESLKKCKTSTCENLICPFGEVDDDIYNPIEDAICIRYADGRSEDYCADCLNCCTKCDRITIDKLEKHGWRGWYCPECFENIRDY